MGPAAGGRGISGRDPGCAWVGAQAQDSGNQNCIWNVRKANLPDRLEIKMENLTGRFLSEERQKTEQTFDFLCTFIGASDIIAGKGR